MGSEMCIRDSGCMKRITESAPCRRIDVGALIKQRMNYLQVTFARCCLQRSAIILAFCVDIGGRDLQNLNYLVRQTLSTGCKKGVLEVIPQTLTFTVALVPKVIKTRNAYPSLICQIALIQKSR